MERSVRREWHVSRAFAISLLFAAAPVLGDTFTVSGATFDKFHKSDKQEHHDVSRADRERPDAPEQTGPSAREIAREQTAAARARAKELKAAELGRIRSNLEILNTSLLEAASRPTSAPPARVLIAPRDPVIRSRAEEIETVIESPEQRVPVLRQRARQEWYWFTANQMAVMWGGLGAVVGAETGGAVEVVTEGGPKEPYKADEPLDEIAFEAREHLANYLELVKELESITHTREYAEQRYQERKRWLTVQRSGDYDVSNPASTAKTDIYPPDDFSPWSEDEIIQRGWSCTFDAYGHTSCRH